MSIGNKISQIREEVRRLKVSLELAKGTLKQLEDSCPHQNTVPAAIVFKIPDVDIEWPVIKCLDCGILKPVLQTKSQKIKPGSRNV